MQTLHAGCCAGKGGISSTLLGVEERTTPECYMTGLHSRKELRLHADPEGYLAELCKTTSRASVGVLCPVLLISCMSTSELISIDKLPPDRAQPRIHCVSAGQDVSGNKMCHSWLKLKWATSSSVLSPNIGSNTLSAQLYIALLVLKGRHTPFFACRRRQLVVGSGGFETTSTSTCMSQKHETYRKAINIGKHASVLMPLRDIGQECILQYR